MKINRTSNRSSGKRRGNARGMSSLELLLLLVVAYFGVSTLNGWVKDLHQERLTDTELQEIAQKVVSVTLLAENAGVDLTVQGNVEATVDRVAQGGVAESGNYRGQFFGMPDLKGEARERVVHHLTYQYDELRVAPAGSYANVD